MSGFAIYPCSGAPSDLPKIDKETQFVLDLLKIKRAEVRNLKRTESP